MRPSQQILTVLGGASGPSLNLSASTIADTASVGDTVGMLSVAGGIGTYTYSLTSNPGTLFSITGAALKVAASLSAGVHAIAITADNGAGSVVTRTFNIVVTHAGSYVPAMKFNDARNSMYVPLI